MKNTRWFLCLDFETDGKDPHTCNPVELAAVPINPDTLEIRKQYAFNTVIRPPGIDTEEYFDDERIKTIEWHAKHAECTYDEVVEKWKDGMDQKTAWKNFCAYCTKYMVDKRPGQWYPQPIPVGYNIIGYDLIIARRLAAAHKTPFPMGEVNKVDIYDMIFTWLGHLPEPFDLQMDTLRPWLGLQSEGQAHSALADVFEEAAIFVKFMKFQRRQSRVDKFKGAFSR